MAEFLSGQECANLTGYKQRNRQAEWLAERGLPFRRDGTRIIIAARHVQQWLEGKTMHARAGLNLNAIK